MLCSGERSCFKRKAGIPETSKAEDDKKCNDTKVLSFGKKGKSRAQGESVDELN